MTPTLPQQHAPRVMPTYPHMLKEDRDLWTRFLREKPPTNCTVAYDVKVGTQPDFIANFPEPYRRMIRALSAKRIDAILFFPAETAVIEVKPWAGTTAVGQSLTYSNLVHLQWPDLPRPFPCIITDRAQPDIPRVCALLHITLIELDPLE